MMKLPLPSRITPAPEPLERLPEISPPKLYEELLYNEENSTPTLNPKIFKGISLKQDYDKIKPALQQLVEVAQTDNKKETVYQLKQIVPEFKSMNSVYEALDEKTYISKKMKSNIMFN